MVQCFERHKVCPPDLSVFGFNSSRGNLSAQRARIKRLWK